MPRKPKTPTHGGARRHSGRKPGVRSPDARVQLSCRVAPATLAALKAAGFGLGVAVDAAVRKAAQENV